MSEWWTDPAGTAAVAFITTLHCALTLLRHHRTAKAVRLTVLPSIALTAFPWVLSSPLWLMGGFLAHVAWFAACERFLPLPLPQAPPPAASPRKAKPPGFQTVPVLATFAETAEIRTFRLGRPEGFTFEAGQFLMVRVEVEGKTLVRCYSITSAPSCTGYLEIGVRNQGIVSRWLHEAVRAGSTLSVNGPGGTFVYPPGHRPIVLLAGGIGITPLLAMLRHGLSTEPRRPITLMLSARTLAHVPFLDELMLLERRHPQFRLAVTLTGGSDDPRFLSGRIDRTVLECLVPEPAAAVYMMCGPLPMIEEMRRIADAAGVPRAQVHFEKFEAAVSEAESYVPGAPATLTLRKSHRVVQVEHGRTILEAVEAAGESFPSMCRVGVCGTCRTRLVTGEVEGDFDALDASEQAEGYILPCVARVRTACVLDA